MIILNLSLSATPKIISTGDVALYALFLFCLLAVMLSPFRQKLGFVNILVVSLVLGVLSFFGLGIEATIENNATMQTCSKVVRISSTNYGYYHDDKGYHVELGKHHDSYDVASLNKGTSSRKEPNHMVIKYYEPKKSTPPDVQKYIESHRVISAVIYTHPDNDPLNFK